MSPACYRYFLQAVERPLVVEGIHRTISHARAIFEVIMLAPDPPTVGPSARESLDAS